MSLLGNGVVAIWNDITPEGRAEFYEWHNREHMPERMAIPGFLRGRRYIATKGVPEYFTLYEATSLDVLSGKDYLARLNAPTPWTLKVVKPHFRNMSRGICTVEYSESIGEGGFIVTLQHGPVSGADQQLRDYLVKSALPPIIKQAGIVGVHLCVADRACSNVSTAEKEGQNVGIPSWLVMIESTLPGGLDDIVHALQDAMTRHGASPDMIAGTYQLEYIPASPPLHSTLQREENVR